MPIYEYRCDNCGHEFETIQKVSEGPLKTCPVCEKEALKKKVSAAAFRLKGGGWYETDFKSDKKRNVAGEEKAASDTAKDGAGKAADGSTKSSDSPAKSAGDKATGESKAGNASSSASSSKAAD